MQFADRFLNKTKNHIFKMRPFVVIAFYSKKNVSILKDTHTGRSDKNRTCDLLNPIQALYQAEPHPDIVATNYNICAIKSQMKSPPLKNVDIPRKLCYNAVW